MNRRYVQAKWQLSEGILEPTVFELGEIGKGGVVVARVEDELRREVGELEDLIPQDLQRGAIGLPGLTEPEVARHYSHLAQMNYGVDSGPYWLGSCTMKYTPKVAMKLESHPSLRNAHPYAPEESVQGILEILYELQEMLSSITGLPKFTLQPAAGAHGELVGALIIRKRFLDLGERRDEILIPESAHGSNFASAAMAGFKVVRIPPSEEGTVDMGALRAAISERTAGMMITNPNTLGIFESDILEIADLLHSNGSYLYYDGANLNAIMGWVRLSDMGVDLAHLNVHKTFSAPHGGGGPGAGAVGVIEELADYLPVPVIVREGDTYRLDYDLPKSIGRVRMFHGNIGVLVKAWGYLKLLGSEGVRLSSGIAVLNANYVRKRLMDMGFEVPYGKDRPCKHEFVISLSRFRREYGVRALDFAKALMDRGVHPPTMYFPLIVQEAFMMEPTESDSLEELDSYVYAMGELADLARSDPDELLSAPKNTAIGRIDDSFANKRLWLSWKVYKDRESS
ncbi:MAG: aminomethyl-transferring glycine dehydrogenase subunit GcvPB [Candidatus Korarchaeota archaeon]|nr:aminomethyl-transferring glycine dehydrogenase subunit GcvPB [Candidatus Korarchaeota archaeon]